MEEISSQPEEIIVDDNDDDNGNGNEDEEDIDELLTLDDNDENNTDFLEVGSFQTEAHLGSSIFGTKVKYK